MIGLNPDGRAHTVDEVVAALTDMLFDVITRMRARIAETEAEPVTQDLLIGITAGLEKHHWMFSVQH